MVIIIGLLVIYWLVNKVDFYICDFLNIVSDLWDRIFLGRKIEYKKNLINY